MNNPILFKPGKHSFIIPIKAIEYKNKKNLEFAKYLNEARPHDFDPDNEKLAMFSNQLSSLSICSQMKKRVKNIYLDTHRYLFETVFEFFDPKQNIDAGSLCCIESFLYKNNIPRELVIHVLYGELIPKKSNKKIVDSAGVQLFVNVPVCDGLYRIAHKFNSAFPEHLVYGPVKENFCNKFANVFVDVSLGAPQRENRKNLLLVLITAARNISIENPWVFVFLAAQCLLFENELVFPAQRLVDIFLEDNPDGKKIITKSKKFFLNLFKRCKMGGLHKQLHNLISSNLIKAASNVKLLKMQFSQFIFTKSKFGLWNLSISANSGVVLCENDLNWSAVEEMENCPVFERNMIKKKQMKKILEAIIRYLYFGQANLWIDSKFVVSSVLLVVMNKYLSLVCFDAALKFNGNKNGFYDLKKDANGCNKFLKRMKMIFKDPRRSSLLKTLQKNIMYDLKYAVTQISCCSHFLLANLYISDQVSPFHLVELPKCFEVLFCNDTLDFTVQERQSLYGKYLSEVEFDEIKDRKKYNAIDDHIQFTETNPKKKSIIDDRLEGIHNKHKLCRDGPGEALMIEEPSRDKYVTTRQVLNKMSTPNEIVNKNPNVYLVKPSKEVEDLNNFLKVYSDDNVESDKIVDFENGVNDSNEKKELNKNENETLNDLSKKRKTRGYFYEVDEVPMHLCLREYLIYPKNREGVEENKFLVIRRQFTKKDGNKKRRVGPQEILKTKCKDFNAAQKYLEEHYRIHVCYEPKKDNSGIPLADKFKKNKGCSCKKTN